MGNFQDKWSKPQKQGFAERITDTLKPKGALKPRVEAAVKRLQAQISKMDGMVSKLKHRDQEIFQKIVTATQQQDTYSSKVLSNELVEVRKVHRILSNAKMGLDRRINVLIYLNKDWKKQYKGCLELWDKEMKNCKQKILPSFNKMVIFSTLML